MGFFLYKPPTSPLPPANTHARERKLIYLAICCSVCLVHISREHEWLSHEVWNARALWKTLSGAADVVTSSPWREVGEDRYGLGEVSFSLRVIIHTYPTAASYTLPRSEWRSPELSYTVHLSTVSVFLWYFSFLSLFSPPFFLRICRTDT